MSASAVAERIAESSTRDKSEQSGKLKDALSALAAWIPSEALGVYTVGYGIFLLSYGPPAPPIGDKPPVEATLTYGDRWTVFVAACLVSVVLIVLQSKKTLAVSPPVKPEADNSPRKRMIYSSILSLVALTIYVANVPGNPFVAILSNWNPAVPPFAAIVAAALIPALGKYFGVSKQQEDEAVERVEP